jgi:methionyl-tRNA formyltransferase
MKIIFAGTPEFAVPSLDKLMQSQHEVLAVYTQPDRPAGRGRHLKPSPIKELAQKYELPVYQPKSLKNKEVQDELRAFNADAIVVVAYGLLLPDEVLEMTPHGCINVHPSLLPRWRGAAPLQRCILAGDKRTGVATMQIDSGLDSGPLYLVEQTDVLPCETSGQLHDRLSVVGAELLVKTLDLIESDDLQPHPQAEEELVYAEKLTKAEAELDWTKSALELQQLVCGYNPWPVAHVPYKGDRLRIWEAQRTEGTTTHPAGSIVAFSKDGIDVATGDGVLRLLTVQLPGGKPLCANEFINREHDLAIGQLLGVNNE